MERITESNLLPEQQDPRASGWATDNLLNPFINGTGVKQIYNNFVSDKNKAEPNYVPEAKTLSTDWAVHTLASASGAVLTYALAGKAANAGLSAIASTAGLEGAAARVMTSTTTASILGAGIYDFAKAPNKGETRLGNAAGSMAAFGVFAAGNEALSASKTIANSSVLTGLGRVGVGMAGGLTSLETSHLVSKALGTQNEVTWNDRFSAMAGGGFINVTMPIVQKGISDAVDGVRNIKSFRFAPDEPAQAAAAQIEGQKGPLRALSINDLPEDLETRGIAAKARPSRPTDAGADAELPKLILLKQQFDARAREAQIARVAGELAGFIGEAKKSVDTAVYDFRLRDPKVEATVVNAYNEAAEAGKSVRIAFFQPEAKAGGNGVVDTTSFDEPMAHGPSPELLAKLSPKIQVQKVTMPESPQVYIPDALGDVVGGNSKVQFSQHLVDLQNGHPGELSGDVGTNGIRGGGKLMHDKYVVRDAGTKDGAVWTGSTNFTDDAFGSQDNNIIQIKNPEIAKTYAKDFAQMWEKGALMGTGANLHTTVPMGDGSMTVAFSPGDGQYIDQEFAKRFADAKDSVRLASMVISSPEMLKALCDDIDRGVKVSGIYDGPQMDQVERGWAKGKNSGEKLEMWNKVKEYLVRKESHPYAPNVIHDFLHDKMFVVDGQNSGTGSFNFSKNATMNAENVVMMDNMPGVASQYTNYIDDLVKTYAGKGRQETPGLEAPPRVEVKPMPAMTPEEAQTTFKTMVEEGKIPHGKFVDSVAAQTRPLSPKQLAVVLDIIAKNQGK